MALESAKKFLQDVQADNSLQEKIDQGAPVEDKMQALTERAKELGYDFTVEELQEAIVNEIELDEDELNNVSGGGRCRVFGTGPSCGAFGTSSSCGAFGSEAFGTGPSCVRIGTND